MRNKKLVSMCVAIGLVVLAGVGGTLAYLSDTSSTLTNTFTTSEKGVDIMLWENEVKENPGFGTGEKSEFQFINTDQVVKASGEDQGTGTVTYKGVLPGSKVEKNPTVTVEKDSEDCYLFVSITNEKADQLTIGGESFKKWKEITPSGESGNTKYYVYTNGQENGAAVKAKEAEQQIKIFDEVKYSFDATEKNQNIGNIIVKAAAIQSANNPYNDTVKTNGIDMLKGLK